MFEQEVKTLYNSILSDKNCSVNLKIQVLKNLQTYLQEEDTRMQQADRDCKFFCAHEPCKTQLCCIQLLYICDESLKIINGSVVLYPKYFRMIEKELYA